MFHTISLPFSWSHGRFFISHGFTNFGQIFSQTHSFLKKQTQAAYSTAAEEHISSIINKNKTSSCSSLSFELGNIVHYVSEDTYNPFQWKPPQDLQKIAKKFTAEYNRQHSSK